jgi:hypothetical protein
MWNKKKPKIIIKLETLPIYLIETVEFYFYTLCLTSNFFYSSLRLQPAILKIMVGSQWIYCRKLEYFFVYRWRSLFKLVLATSSLLLKCFKSFFKYLLDFFEYCRSDRIGFNLELELVLFRLWLGAVNCWNEFSG